MKTDFGRRLAQARQLRGFVTQRSLADAVGVSPFSVSKWEIGRNYPNTAELLKLIDALACTSDWLLFGRSQGLSEEARVLLLEGRREALAGVAP